MVQVNSTWDVAQDAALQHPSADISIAVATDGGLITPIIARAETKGLAEIDSELGELAKRAREGALKPEEYQGAACVEPILSPAHPRNAQVALFRYPTWACSE